MRGKTHKVNGTLSKLRHVGLEDIHEDEPMLVDGVDHSRVVGESTFEG